MAKRWYVIHTYSGYENKVKTATYRQLFATRITLKDIDRRLTAHGL